MLRARYYCRDASYFAAHFCRTTLSRAADI